MLLINLLMENSNINQKYYFRIESSAIIPFKAYLFLWSGILLFPD